MSAFALRLAILPSILLLLFVVGKNKQRRNPTSLLVWLAVLGAVSAIPAVIVEILGSGLLYMLGLDPSSAMYNFCGVFFHSCDDRGAWKIPWNAFDDMEEQEF